MSASPVQTHIYVDERNQFCNKHMDAQTRVMVVDFQAKKGQGLNEFLPLPDKGVGGGEQLDVSVVNIQPTWQQKL